MLVILWLPIQMSFLFGNIFKNVKNPYGCFLRRGSTCLKANKVLQKDRLSLIINFHRFLTLNLLNLNGQKTDLV